VHADVLYDRARPFTLKVGTGNVQEDDSGKNIYNFKKTPEKFGKIARHIATAGLLLPWGAFTWSHRY